MSKESGSKTVKASVSLEEDVLKMGKTVAKQIGYTFSFSAYVNGLIKKDIQCRIAPSRSLSASTPI